MSNEVYANGNAISCKAGDGKVIAAMPDVCLSPPSPPAGPIPVPYPDTSFSKDMQNGSKTVQIDGQEVMLKDQSFFATSPLGDEAATKGLGASVVTHVITGKTYFAAWSMDVQFEGANVDRNLDLTTSNHASDPGSTPPIPEAEAAAAAAAAEALRQECGKQRAGIQEQNAKLGKELRKYDPVSDAKGGFVKHGGIPGPTIPGGHYVKIRNFQRGLRKRIKKFNDDCQGSGIKLDKSVNENANREITPPPGFPRIPLTL